MRKVGAVAGVLASVVAITASAAINARFGWSLGRTELDSEILAAVSIGSDIFKAFGLGILSSALVAGQLGRAIGAALLWFVVFSYSLCSAVGFAAVNRSDTASERTQSATHYSDLRGRIEELNQKLHLLPAHRGVDVLSTDIAQLKLSSRWEASAHCSQPSSPPSWCYGYRQMESELATARQDDQWSSERDALVKQTGAMPAVTEGDPQSAALATVTMATPATVRSGLVILVAVLVEIGSSLGLYVSTGGWNTAMELPERVSRLEQSINQPSLQSMWTTLRSGKRSVNRSGVASADQLIDAEPVDTPSRLITNGRLFKVPVAHPALLRGLVDLSTDQEWNGQISQLADHLGWTKSTTRNRLVEARAAGAIALDMRPRIGTYVKLMGVS